MQNVTLHDFERVKLISQGAYRWALYPWQPDTVFGESLTLNGSWIVDGSVWRIPCMQSCVQLLFEWHMHVLPLVFHLLSLVRYIPSPLTSHPSPLSSSSRTALFIWYVSSRQVKGLQWRKSISKECWWRNRYYFMPLPPIPILLAPLPPCAPPTCRWTRCSTREIYWHTQRTPLLLDSCAHFRLRWKEMQK